MLLLSLTPTAISPQPPVVADTLYVGNAGWGPADADPAYCYDTGSAELIFNVYDTLISSGAPVTTYETFEVHEQYWEFSPSLATNVPSREDIRKTVSSQLVPPNPVGFVFDDGSVCIGWADNHKTGGLDKGDVIYTVETDGSYRTWFVEPITHAPENLVLWRGRYEFQIRTTSYIELETLGTGDNIVFSTTRHPVIENSETLYEYEGPPPLWYQPPLIEIPKANYTIEYPTGRITFNTAPGSQYVVYASYSASIPFVDETGSIVDLFDVYDAEYSFKRGLVQDMYGSPEWMFYKPFFDQMNSDWWDTGNAVDAVTLSHLINDTVEVSGNDLILNVGIQFPDLAFKQIITQTWSAIMSEEWCKAQGLFDGDLFSDANADGFPDWWMSWRHLDPASDPINGVEPAHYVGTGPYRVTVADQPSSLVVLGRNPNYWRGWPAPGRGDNFFARGYLENVELRYIASWTTRKTDFLNSNLDTCYVPRQFIDELLDEYGEPIDPTIKTIKSLRPVLSNDAAFFQLTINPSSRHILSGQFPDGVPPTFFNDTHVRKTFAYGFNHTAYIDDIYRGEASWRGTPLIYGLIPDYYTTGSHSPYDASLSNAESELKQAIFNGTSVWDSGFAVELPYWTGYIHVQAAWEILRDFFVRLSTYDGRTGPPFTIIVVGEMIPWSYNEWWEGQPMFVSGWLGDFADADNFARPYMYSTGYFAAYQNYTEANGWGSRKDELIDMTVKTPDGTDRAALYAELQDIYLTDVPSFPVAQPIGRMWMKYWVKGWSYNALYPSDYYYYMHKLDSCWADVTGVYPTIPDGICSVRDIGIIANHFGAKAPDPSSTPMYEIKWAPGGYGGYGWDVTGDRKIDMRDIGFACRHFGDTTEP